MIESIQFSEGVLHLAVTSSGLSSSCQCQGSIEFYFGESGAIAELHRSQFMDFLNSVYPIRAGEVCHLVFELLGAKTTVCCVDFHRFDSCGKSLEDSATPDVLIQLADGAVESASSEEYISF